VLITLQLSFEDRDTNVRQHQVNFVVDEAALTISGAVSFLSTYANLCQAVSDAVVSGAKIRLPRVDASFNAAGVDSDAYRRLTLFSLTNTNQASSISIPSPRLELFDVMGDFAGFRLIEQIAPLNTTLAPLFALGTLVDEAGRVVASPFVVGSRSVQL